MSQELLVVDNFLSPDECARTIAEIDDMIAQGFSVRYGTHASPRSTQRDDEQLFVDDPHIMALGTNTNFWMTFRQRYEEAALPVYLDRFPILKEMPLMTVQCKLQKTHPGGGFHRWHYEQYDGVNVDRVLTYSLFLNDGFGGGETEFLYYRTRVEPKAGRLCVFPAHWGATHRGNPPLNGPKYIATGWTLNTHMVAT